MDVKDNKKQPYSSLVKGKIMKNNRMLQLLNFTVYRASLKKSQKFYLTSNSNSS